MTGMELERLIENICDCERKTDARVAERGHLQTTAAGHAVGNGSEWYIGNDIIVAQFGSLFVNFFISLTDMHLRKPVYLFRAFELLRLRMHWSKWMVELTLDKLALYLVNQFMWAKNKYARVCTHFNRQATSAICTLPIG